MVKMQAVQSALAIRRQRSRREDQKRAMERHASNASLSTPRPSVVSLDGRVYFNEKRENKTMFGQVTMFHVGSVFIVIGLMLTFTSLVPGYVKSTTPERRSDLLGTGCFFVFLGGVLTTISRFVSNNEEKELNQYIKGRLSRTKSGHRLVRDAESGLPTPTRERRNKPQQNGVAHNSSPESPGHSSRQNGGTPKKTDPSQPGTASEVMDEEAACSNPCTTEDGEAIAPSASMEPVLSRILEEDENDADTEAATEPQDSTPESSLTPTSPLETQGLLERHHSSPRKGSKSSTKSSSKSSRLSGV